MSSNNTKDTSKRQAQDGFFIVSKETWCKLFTLATKEHNDTKATRILCTYLVLCCGSDKTHQKSTWSSGAIYKRVGISPSASKKDIEWLENNQFIKVKKAARKNVSPDYRINFYGNNPCDSYSDDNTYVPNGIVDAVADEQPPLKILRDHHDPQLLYLFIRLYAFQNKYLDVISPDIVSTALSYPQRLDATLLYETPKEIGSTLRVWGLDADLEPRVSINGKTNFYINKQDDNEHVDFIQTLMGLGLVYRVTHLCNGEMAYSDDDIENLLGFNVHEQAEYLEVVCCSTIDFENKPTNAPSDWMLATEITKYNYVTVLPSQYKKVHYQQFLKMRYRTKLGAAPKRIADEQQIKNNVEKLVKGLDLKTKGII